MPKIISKRKWRETQAEIAECRALIEELKNALELVPLEKLSENYVWFPSPQTLETLSNAKLLTEEKN